MSTNCADEKWVHSDSLENEVEEEDPDQEALSLCDLPINEENQSKSEPIQAKETQEDFYFGSWSGSVLTESQMCAADEVFFQGQILPLRHSVSSESGLRNHTRNIIRYISRSESMDHCYSGGFVSSRSSSVRSHNSSSSGSTSTTATIPPAGYKPKARNHFHSHPSPTPQIRTQSLRHGNHVHSSRKSTTWSFFQVGLLRTPEVGLTDVKVRNSINNRTIKSFGSCNSSSALSNGRNVKDLFKTEKKKKQRFFDKNGGLFGGCKCSVNAVETVHSKIVNIKSTNGKEERELEAKTIKQKKTKEENNQGKQAMSRHRTFEWLKQLSLEEGEA